MRGATVPGEQRSHHHQRSTTAGRRQVKVSVLTAAAKVGVPPGCLSNRAEDDLVAAMGILAEMLNKKRAYDDG